MNKLYIVFSFLFLNFSLFSQYNSKNILIEDQKSQSNRSTSEPKNCRYGTLNKELLNEIKANISTNQAIVLPVPDVNKTDAKMNLSEINITTGNFHVEGTESGKFEYSMGKAFKADNTNSTGAIYTNENFLMGVISNDEGNIIIGKMAGSQDKYIVYNDQNLDINKQFKCSALDQYPVSQIDRNENQKYYRKASDKCIDIYIEADYALYKNNDYSIQKTTDYILGLFAESYLIYKNEGINIRVSKIKIWQSKDDYDVKASHTALDQFTQANAGSETNLNLLLAEGAEGLGGIAWVNQLCGNLNFAYANIDQAYKNIPTYSWSVMVITHELGHNLGSGHTHGCYWNGNNSQIDDCGNVYLNNSGDSPEGKACFDENNPKYPVNGGTVMSYCHLIGTVGINLKEGFGKQPGDLIRKRVAEAICVDFCDDFGEQIPIPEFTVNHDTACIGGEVEIKDLSTNNPTEWLWKLASSDTTMISEHKNPVFSFTKIDSFNLSLVVSNAVGKDSLMKSNFIRVIDGPQSDFSYEFIDAQNVQFTSKATNADKYLWNFGDGAVSYKENPKHKFNRRGIFKVSCKAGKAICGTFIEHIDSIEIKIPDKADFYTDKLSVCPGDSIKFTAVNENYDSVHWVFEGGNLELSDSFIVNVKYTVPGKYSVRLIAFSTYGSDTISKPEYIIVKDLPIADFDYYTLGDTLHFVNKSTFAKEYFWNLGNVDSSFIKDPEIIFGNSGIYTIILEAKNDCGENSISKDINFIKVGNFELWDNNIKIWPNPNVGQFKIYIDSKNLEDIGLELFSFDGNKIPIDNGDVHYYKNLITVDKLNNINSGVYILKIKFGTISIYKKLIIYN